MGLTFPSCARRYWHPSRFFAILLVMRESAEIMSDEELFSLPVEIQHAVANQRLEGLELPREIILDSLRQIRGEVSIEELIRKYKTR
jgi:Antitoxin VbhA